MKKIEASKGQNMYSAARYGCLIALREGANIELSFNDVSVTVYPDSNSSDIYEKIYFKQELSRLK